MQFGKHAGFLFEWFCLLILQYRKLKRYHCPNHQKYITSARRSQIKVLWQVLYYRNSMSMKNLLLAGDVELYPGPGNTTFVLLARTFELLYLENVKKPSAVTLKMYFLIIVKTLFVSNASFWKRRLPTEFIIHAMQKNFLFQMKFL